MLNKVKKINRTPPAKKLLVMSLSAIMTTSISMSTLTQASDIDIYQQARSGDITLMMLFDISGSMGAPQLVGDADACDIPSGTSVASSGNSPSGTTPSYTRYYCNVIDTKTYKYRYQRSNNVSNRWSSCTNEAEERDRCNWGAAVSTRPTGINSDLNPTSGSNLIRESTNSYYYYYEGYTRQYPDRLTRIKDAMFDLLQGNVDKGITPVADDKIIGISAYSFNGTGNNGYVLMPARRLSDDVTINGVTKKHREWLLDAVANKLYARGGTPTGNAYAEAAAYLMGTKTFDNVGLYTAAAGKNVFFTYTSGSETYYTQCMVWNNNGDCAYWPSSTHSNTAARPFNFLPIDLTKYTTSSCTVKLKNSSSDGGTDRTGTCYKYTGGIARDSVYNGFNYSISSAKNANGTAYLKPDSMTQTDEIKQCSGQGIYVLSDGVPSGQTNEQNAMRNALNDSTFACNGTADGTGCVLNFSNRLLNNNPTGLKIKTAVVGFGKDFNNIASFDRAKTQEENLAALGTIDTAVKRAAEWGIKGEGGWYSGSSSNDVVDSVNNFINSLSSEIPAVTTGTPTIPLDELNPVVLQNFAYYPQFQPTPDKTYQLWAGNMKKYKVGGDGMLRDKRDSLIVDTSGRILDNYDLWSTNITNTSTDAEQMMALVGGVKSKLKLRTPENANTANRKLVTNRDFTPNAVDQTGTALKTVDLSYITNSMTSSDPKAGSLMNLLGYDFDPSLISTGSLTLSQLNQQAELRQIGGVMHSSPLLITNKGKIVYDESIDAVSSEDREDYILFGTTQGLLHVVDAQTGEEKFAFVPNEMIETQSQAFGKPELSNLGMGQLFYGVDGPWTAYTEYVQDLNADSNETSLTVGTNSYGQTGKQLVYGGLRMGGRNYYALDLSDISNPKLKFQIRPSGDCSATNPLGCMGQSWSKPSITWVNWNGVKKLVMLVGGGYDAGGDDGNAFVNGIRVPYAGYESHTYNQTNKRGAGVYMFDALDGSLLWWASANASNDVTNVLSTHVADMKYSVVSEIRTIDRDSDGLTDHLYFGDLGGQVWRIDLNNDAKTEQNLFVRTPTKLLNLNNAEKSPRFYESPAFSTYTKNGVIFGVVTIGSGNRSSPLVDYTIGEAGRDYDAVYNIYDKDVAKANLLTLVPKSATNPAREYLLTDANLVTKNVTLQSDTVTAITDDSANKLIALDDTSRFSKATILASLENTQGWYYKFKSYKLQSEKVFSTPIVINNDLYVTTFDGSKDGLAGDCGAGVKGESFMTLFCMPYGQCNGGDVSSYRLNLGAGIVGGAVGAGDSSGMQRLIVANVDSRNATSGRAILDKRYPTADQLIPQRWFERR